MAALVKKLNQIRCGCVGIGPAIHKSESKKPEGMKMTTKQADKLIQSQASVAVRWNDFQHTTGIIRIVRRDRFKIYTDDESVFDRASTMIVDVDRQ